MDQGHHSWYLAYQILVSAKVLLVLTLGLWTLDFGLDNLSKTNYTSLKAKYYRQHVSILQEGFASIYLSNVALCFAELLHSQRVNNGGALVTHAVHGIETNYPTAEQNCRECVDEKGGPCLSPGKKIQTSYFINFKVIELLFS